MNSIQTCKNIQVSEQDVEEEQEKEDMASPKLITPYGERGRPTVLLFMRAKQYTGRRLI